MFFKRYEKMYTYYLLSIHSSRGYESFHDDRVLVTCTNKVNFLIFCLLTTLISQIMKEPTEKNAKGNGLI